VKAKKQMRSRYADEEENLQTVIFPRVSSQSADGMFPLVNEKREPSPSALWKGESRGVSLRAGDWRR